jgi:predicted Kef-type K+ transport protein
MENFTIFRDIAMVFAAACVCGLLAWRLRQPILLGYVLAGLLLSPLTPGPRVHDIHEFEVMAEVGVVLLMFSVGIEFSIPDLLRVRWVALAGAPLGILVSIALGAGVGALLGWPVVQGIAVGCIISVASTMVLMRLLMDRNEISTDAGRVMIRSASSLSSSRRSRCAPGSSLRRSTTPPSRRRWSPSSRMHRFSNSSSAHPPSREPRLPDDPAGLTAS